MCARFDAVRRGNGRHQHIVVHVVSRKSPRGGVLEAALTLMRVLRAVRSVAYSSDFLLGSNSTLRMSTAPGKIHCDRSSGRRRPSPFISVFAAMDQCGLQALSLDSAPFSPACVLKPIGWQAPVAICVSQL